MCKREAAQGMDNKQKRERMVGQAGWGRQKMQCRQCGAVFFAFQIGCRGATSREIQARKRGQMKRHVKRFNGLRRWVCKGGREERLGAWAERRCHAGRGTGIQTSRTACRGRSGKVVHKHGREGVSYARAAYRGRQPAGPAAAHLSGSGHRRRKPRMGRRVGPRRLCVISRH